MLPLLLLLSQASCPSDQWIVEAQSPQSIVTWQGDTCDIQSPAGITLWYHQPLTAGTVIQYDARIVADSAYCDADGRLRISDLNCFWMADRRGQQTGRFEDYYTQQLYYVGYGGNSNTTTRFRRYTGDTLAVTDASRRPAILQEYTDSTHLIRPDHWYHIRLELTTDGHARYTIDGQTLVDYADPQPLRQGYFGFRTTLSHAQFCNFRVDHRD